MVDCAGPAENTSIKQVNLDVRQLKHMYSIQSRCLEAECCLHRSGGDNVASFPIVAPAFRSCGVLINNIMRREREERTLPSLRIQLKTDSPKNDELIGQFLAKSAMAMDLERLHAGIVPQDYFKSAVSRDHQTTLLLDLLLKYPDHLQ